MSTFLEIPDDCFNKKYCCSNYQDWNVESATLEHITYEDFLKNYMLTNQPCIVKNVSATWNCTKEWVKNDKINYSYLKTKYGMLKAPVADCNNIKYNSHCKQEMSILDYINYMERDDKTELLYLKDWHLRRALPDDHFYRTPTIFASDWLNEYTQDKKEDDFMFVYIGPRTSWTPLHADVYSSYSWSVNVVGRKKWILFPPGEEEKLKDSLGNLPVLFKPERFNNIKYFDVTQEKGDAIFIPSGWYHQVFNEKDTISVNHNWINGCNIKKVWESLLQNLVSVEHEIKEFRDTAEYPQQCQLILKSVFGMDFVSFLSLLCHIGEKRLAQLEGCSNLAEFYLGKNQIKFDLEQVLKILDISINHSVFVNNTHNLLNIPYDFINLKDTITSALK